MIDKITLLDRCKGALVGLAVGDALGATNEFKKRKDVTILTDIIGGGPFNLKAGQWTDDTSMALCLAASLVERGFDLKDQLEKYIQWRDKGYMSYKDECFDIGNITDSALSRYQRTGEVTSGSTDVRSSGNGNIMRLAPVVIKYHSDIITCIFTAEMQSITTHGSLLCKESAALMAEIMFSCLHHTEDDKDSVLRGSKNKSFITDEVKSINNGIYKTVKDIDQVWTSGGFVASTLEFALWCFYNTNTFEDCVLMAANAGGDADTNAAVAGQIAGAYYGYGAIPSEWLNKLVWHEIIVYYAKKLSELNT